GGQIRVVLTVHQHHGRTHASGQALFLHDQRDPPIGGGLAAANAELLLNVGDQLVGAAQHAGDVVVDVDLVPPNRLQEEVAVEVGHLVDLHPRHAQIVSDGVQVLPLEPAAIAVLADV